MNGLVGHSLILLGAGIAACVISFAIERPADPGGAPSVILAHKRPARGAPEVAGVPENRDGLARLLERELTRIGCYGGAISGAWGKAPRQAMRAFLVHINARLPVDQPDEILLRLLRAEQQRVCTEPCPEHDSPAQGACLPDGPATKVSAQPAPEPTATGDAPRAVPSAQREPEGGPDHGPTSGPDPGPEPMPRIAAAAAASADTGASGGSEDAAGPRWRLAGVPPTPRAAQPSDASDASEPPPAPHIRRTVRHARARHAKRPPKIVRLLIRNLGRLAPFGMR
jgi:hypothetical protein